MCLLSPVLIFLLVIVYLSARTCHYSLPVSPILLNAPDIWKGFQQVKVWLVPLKSVLKLNSIPRHANGAISARLTISTRHCELSGCGSSVVCTFIVSFFVQPKTGNIYPLHRRVLQTATLYIYFFLCFDVLFIVIMLALFFWNKVSPCSQRKEELFVEISLKSDFVADWRYCCKFITFAFETDISY